MRRKGIYVRQEVAKEEAAEALFPVFAGRKQNRRGALIDAAQFYRGKSGIVLDLGGDDHRSAVATRLEHSDRREAGVEKADCAVHYVENQYVFARNGSSPDPQLAGQECGDCWL